ncbi:unnamed protein product [Timema podura]|uniref:Uncharacterized protein n=1 Tax=Timema podura TaxID=61482 RepID=A0ABN7NUA6_TIMPD|nr:unnamed protein product [Timema podura]
MRNVRWLSKGDGKIALLAIGKSIAWRSKGSQMSDLPVAVTTLSKKVLLAMERDRSLSEKGRLTTPRDDVQHQISKNSKNERQSILFSTLRLAPKGYSSTASSVLDFESKSSRKRRSYIGRRMTTSALDSLLAFRRGSTWDYDKRGIPRLMNTYQLDSRTPFVPDIVHLILREVMTLELREGRYDAPTCSDTASNIALEIMTRVKLQRFERYKLGCQIMIVQKNDQSLHSALSFLWDADRDGFVTYRFENKQVYAVALVFGTYYDGYVLLVLPPVRRVPTSYHPSGGYPRPTTHPEATHALPSIRRVPTSYHPSGGYLCPTTHPEGTHVLPPIQREPAPYHPSRG